MRGYIAYFEQQCCQEYVLYDSEQANLFKESIRLTPSCPGLCHAVVSVAALHLTLRIASAQCNEKIMAYDSNPYEVQLSQSADQVRHLYPLPAYHDALYHKQRTLSFLRSEAYAGCFSNPDGVIASMIMSIWFELMESGRDTWKYHLRGLREVMPKRGASLALFWGGESAADLPQMTEYFETSYAIFEIIGSTFVKAKQPYQPLFLMPPTLDILKRYSILHHLQSMDPAGVHLKGILWPAFVIGAEAQTVSQRAFVTDVFGHLWTLWRCHNVTNALKVLEKIWARRAMDGSSRRWIEYVYEWGEDWMFI
ncbi:hypothetical protein N8T08_009834 [Aspergillus melleus]|uniref:Uncharacterized protein n=1 Tax=Aspergillus melleus TaxID=138277 RepID=A0ACC3ASU4_9EURO|nr:hypothetical protein N8T08_009834 [Aspergillus melleus]